jgi:hypothetical protein
MLGTHNAMEGRLLGRSRFFLMPPFFLAHSSASSLAFGVNMVRLPSIVVIRVVPAEPPVDCLTVRCLGGRAKWSPDSRALSLKADVIDDEAHDKWADFFASRPPAFELELDCQTGASPQEITKTHFSRCAQATLEWRSATARPKGPATSHYYLKAIAELGAPPNGGPAEPLGGPDVGGGPPSVS